MQKKVIKVGSFIKRIEMSENPLSADVFFVQGREYTYIVDVGSNDASYEAVKAIPKKKIIITHFHADHAENLRRLKPADEDLYVGDYTAKYYGGGTVIKEPMHIEDGVFMDILPLPSSHAKGSLTVIVNKTVILLGDGCYSNNKGYNVSLLHDMIKILKAAEFTTAIKSHESKEYTKEELIEELETIYSLREKNNPYISLEKLRAI